MVAPVQSLRHRCGARFRALLHRQAPKVHPGLDIPASDPSQTLLNSLRSSYPGARLSMPGSGKVLVELPGGDVLRFYVRR
jgi:hypothetical protein